MYNFCYTSRNYLFQRLRRTYIRIKRAIKEKGLFYLFRCCFIKLFDWTIAYYYCILFRSSCVFTFNHRVYPYFYHKYNRTWRSERAVEIPIIWDIVSANSDKMILEVGNVLSHYFVVNHDILDKYEKDHHVCSQVDVIDFNCDKKYDLIVSISTLEHIGWDEVPHDPLKVLKAVQNLKHVLARGGRLCVTLPIGYNSDLDKLLKLKRLGFTKISCLKRIHFDEWIETDYKSIQDSVYDYLLFFTSGLLVGIVEKA